MNRGVVVAPLRIAKNKKGDKQWSVNLNQYRNTHFQSLNSLKKRYKDLVYLQVDHLSPFTCIRLTIHIYAANKRLFDIGNVGSIHEKFFLDALVELGKLPDDDYNHCPETHTYFKGIDKDHPRVEFIIEEIPMSLFQIDKPDRIPVNIRTTEHDLVQLVKEAIAKEDPSIDVTDVRLVGLEAIEIDAFVGEAPKKKTTRKTTKKAEPKKEEVPAEVLNEVVEAQEKKETEAEKPVETAEDKDLPFDLDDVTDPEAASANLSFADQELSLIDEVLAEDSNEGSVDEPINTLSFDTNEEEESEPETGGTTVADIFK